jgi:hypothetical protein
MEDVRRPCNRYVKGSRCKLHERGIEWPDRVCRMCWGELLMVWYIERLAIYLLVDAAPNMAAESWFAPHVGPWGNLRDFWLASALAFCVIFHLWLWHLQIRDQFLEWIRILLNLICQMLIDWTPTLGGWVLQKLTSWTTKYRT